MKGLVTRDLKALQMPHYSLVPKGMEANLAFRREVLRMASHDRALQAQLRTMCAEDVLFYLNVFGWTYDPRRSDMRTLPFITYREFQDDAILALCEAVWKGHDVAVPKSRCMGASWMGLAVFEWFWHYYSDMSFLLISRNEDYVDMRGNPKSLFWKIDCLHENQPRWLLPQGRWLGWDDPNRKLLHLRNADTGSVIDGESTTGDAGRGDRRTAMFIDEHAAFEINDGFRVLRATRDTTKCRIFNSTPQGATNAFAEVCFKTSARHVRLHWSSHPVYNRGLYTTDPATKRVKVLSEYRGPVTVMRKGWSEPQTFAFPGEYPFILDGKTRSPWYDSEEARCVSEADVAQELDIDFLGSDHQFFDGRRLNELIAKAGSPWHTGELEWDSDTLEPSGFMPHEKGRLRLWLNLDEHGRPPASRGYVIAADIATGTGASNSCLSIGDMQTCRKVGELATPYLKPHELARYALALANWFGTPEMGAFMIWEANGPGRIFGDEVIKHGYRNIYYRHNEQRIGAPSTDFPGFWSNDDTKLTLLSQYRKALDDSTFENPSREGLNECLRYVYTKTGAVAHAAAQSDTDPSGARQNHGDRVIADALCCKVLVERVALPPPPEPEVVPGSFLARRQERERERQLAGVW